MFPVYIDIRFFCISCDVCHVRQCVTIALQFFLSAPNSATDSVDVEVLAIAAKNIKQSTLLQLVYQRALQFNRGTASSEVLPHSEMKILRENKNQLAIGDRNKATSLERLLVLVIGYDRTGMSMSTEYCCMLCYVTCHF